MLLTLLHYQWTAFRRSKGKTGTIAAQIVMGLLVLYIIACAVLVGYSMETLINHFLPDKEVIFVFNGIILYYFAIDFLVRLQMQELPTLAVVPYLHLNIPRSGLVNFLNIRALFSAFNLIPLLLFFPFCILQIGDEYGAFVSVMYMLSIFSLTIFNNYAALYFKRRAIGNLKLVVWGLLFLILIALSEYFKLFSIAACSNIIFHYLTLQPAVGFAFVLLACGMFMINARYIRNNLYIEELAVAEKRKSATDYPFLDRFGEAGTLVALEIKLILRNKRPRATVSKGLIFLFYGLLLYKKDLIDQDKFWMMLFPAIFMTGNTIILYGQFMFSWQSAAFDGLLANKTDMRTFFKAKMLLLTLSATLLTVVTSLYGLISWKILAVQLAAYLYNIGIGTVVVLYFATRNYKYIDLRKGASFNWQGVGATSMIMSIPLLLSPYVIYLPLALIGGPYYGLAGIAVLGLAAVLTRNFWLGFLLNEFNKRKYKITEGFRAQS